MLTAMRGTVKIKGPRWSQNHDYAPSEAESIAMIWHHRGPIILTVPWLLSSRYFFYIPNKDSSNQQKWQWWKVVCVTPWHGTLAVHVHVHVHISTHERPICDRYFQGIFNYMYDVILIDSLTHCLTSQIRGIYEVYKYLRQPTVASKHPKYALRHPTDALRHQTIAYIYCLLILWPVI